MAKGFKFDKVLLNCTCRIDYNNIHEFLDKQKCKVETVYYATHKT